MRRLSSFTLVEMIIVIVIVSIMLLISLNISSSQTKILRFKIARETFITNYNTWLIRAITTNSQDISLYLDYNNDNNPSYQPIFAEGTSASSLNFEDASQVNIVSINGELSDQKILFDNQLGGCKMETTGNPATITTGENILVVVNYKANADVCAICYNLDLSSCKLKQSTCDPAPTNC